MKLLIDAQLPMRLARSLTGRGHDAIHTSDLPDGNRTTDTEICRVADVEGRIVVTKDRDFRNNHLLRGTPEKLLVVATGNTSNNELLALVEANLGAIEAALQDAAFVELTGDRLIIHGRQ